MDWLSATFLAVVILVAVPALLVELVGRAERRRLQREQDQLAQDLADLDAAIDRVLKEHRK
jgi:Flp pilus assembly protein TadB